MTENPQGGTTDPRHFRNVLGQNPTGVAVVTALHDGEPVAMTVGSFGSISLDPPLVAFVPDKGSSSWAALRASGSSYCVNVLAEHQDDVCRLVATRKTDKLEGIEWHLSAHGNPIVSGCLATVECVIDTIHDGGDHDIVVCRVVELNIESPVSPLLFFRGAYGTFQPRNAGGADADLFRHMRQVDLVRKHLQSFADEVGSEVTTVHLVGDELVLTASFGDHEPGTPSRVGYRAPFVPPLGSVHAAWGDDELQEHWLANLGPGVSEAQLEHYRGVLCEVRRRGYATSMTADRRLDTLALGMSAGEIAMSMSRLRDHVMSVADEFNPTRLNDSGDVPMRGLIAPVFDAVGSVAFQLMIWGERGRVLDRATFDRHVDLLLAAAEHASEMLQSS